MAKLAVKSKWKQWSDTLCSLTLMELVLDPFQNYSASTGESTDVITKLEWQSAEAEN